MTSLARPGGNLTGINFFAAELAAKRLELLRELVPSATRVAVLVNPSNAENTEATLRDVEAAARTMGLQIRVINASTSREIDAAFTSFVHERPDALFVEAALVQQPTHTIGTLGGTLQRSRHLCWSTNYRSWRAYELRGEPDGGNPSAWADAGRILKGAKPGDLPVEQATKFELEPTPRPPGCSAWRRHRRCSPAPTR